MIKSERRLRRLLTPMTAGETSGLLAGIILGIALFVSANFFVSQWLAATSDLGWFLLFLLAGIALPAFLGVTLAGLPTSWRHKPLAATLSMFVLIGLSMRDIVLAFENGFYGFLGGVIRFSFMMVGALVAIFLWRELQQVRTARAAAGVEVPVPRAQRMPQVPFALLLLFLVSIPVAFVALILSMFVTIGLSSLLLLVLLEAERVPGFLLIAAGLAMVIAVFSSVIAIAGIFKPRIATQGGRRIDLASHRSVRTLIAEVCARVGTAMPDNVLLIPEPQFFVTQSRLVTPDGPMRGRTLALGLPLLKVMRTEELATVLAHEFAHFSGRDTLFTTLAAPVYRGLEVSLRTMGDSRGMSGSLTTIVVRFLALPEFHFLQALFWYFHSLNMALSRRRELRADWISARSFGTEAAASALRCTEAAIPGYFEALKTIPLDDPADLFTAWAAYWVDRREVRRTDREPKAAAVEAEFDSHPSTAARIASLPDMQADGLADAANLQPEIREIEQRVSLDLAPALRNYREQLRETGNAAEAEPASAAATGAVLPSSTGQSRQAHCPRCGVDVVLTERGCCPDCGEHLV